MIPGARFERAPARVYWELTRACDLACRHCRAAAIPERARDELATRECERALRELAAAGPPPPHVVFTGGDPLKRPDLLELVRYGVGLGLGVSVAPSATVGLTRETVAALKEAGVSAMSLSLDGSSPARHDGLRGVLGCFGWTLVAAQRIVGAGIPLQINTLVTAETAPDLESTARVVARMGAARWSLFFLVSVGRGRALRPIEAAECERTLRWLARQASAWPFTVTTTEAPQFRRVVIETMRAAGARGSEIRESPAARAFGVRDGNGIMFIAANGDVTPSGFLPLAAGNVRAGNAAEIYRDAALFRSLREPERFHGRCGVCGYRAVCGGSRARAWAATGDVMGEDPLCAYEPAGA
ncbi:MAG: TIGR04053 family radical SAM/SPASM domain-containing protein [candidate division NC10 bacterium]|nr:TIGR04053 family radical SAM/SPASM domain-containing protein [candidate division NC10 bacterium]